METVKGICILILIVLVTCLIYDWVTFPWKIDKSNNLLEEILRQLKNKDDV